MIKQKFLVWLFCGLFAAAFVANILIVPPDYSEEENRYLAEFPEFSFKELFYGDYTMDLENFIRDRFFARDFWVGLKAGSEVVLQKKENNSVIFGDDGYLMEDPGVIDAEHKAENLEKVEAFIEKNESAGKHAYVALVPNAMLAMKDKLPSTYPIDSLLGSVLELEEKESLNPIKLFDAIYSHSNEYIYYRTDHHWTSLGAYYAYVEICNQLGVTPRSLKEFTITTVSDDFLGTMYSKSGAKWSKSDSVEIFEVPGNTYSVTLDGEIKSDSMFFTDHLEKKDKYSVYLDGNHALAKIENPNGNGKKILLVKDSFAHALAPLLAADFSEVHMIDLRYYRGSVSGYMDENRIRDVVLLYGATNFMTDANLAFIR